MKRSILFILGILLSFSLLAGDLIKIRINEAADIKSYLRDPNLTVHYYTDHFLLATVRQIPAYPCDFIASDTWKGTNEYFLAWFRPEDAGLYKQDVSQVASILYTDTDHMILEVPADDVPLLLPAIHNGLVRINNRPVRLPENPFPFTGSRFEEDPFVTGLLDQVSSDSILMSVQHLQEYGSRDCFTSQAVEAQQWIKAKFESYGLQTELMDFNMPGGEASDNVIATLDGTVYPDELIVLGAHYDSRSWSGLAPGADDNATGTAGILEIARILSQHEFKRTIIFCTWSGEEYGLYGSEAYASWAEDEGLNILGYFNQDMTGYLQEGSEIHTDVMAPASAVEFREFYRDVCEVYLPDFQVENGSLTGGDSDHSSFNAHGYMGIFPFEDSQNYSPYIHTSNDLIGPSVNNIEQSGIFTQSVLASAVTMANMLTGPQKLVAIPGDGSVTLSWKKLVEAASYNIYKNDPETPFINITDTIYIDLEVENGTAYTYFITAIYAGNGEESVPSNEITVIPMPPIAFPFMEDFESGAPYWTMEGTWGLTDEVFHSPIYSLTDSPDGNYANNLNISTTLQNLNLEGATGGTLSFWTKYALESGYDYVYLEVTTDGSDWDIVDQFNGNQITWTFKEYPLDSYIGKPYVVFRFRLSTDVFVQQNGINIDDLQIEVWGVGLAESKNGLSEIRIYPNPFNGSVSIEFSLPQAADVSIDVFSQDGKWVTTLMNEPEVSGSHSVTWDGKDSVYSPVESGIYSLRFRSGDQIITKKLVKIR